MSDTIGSLIDKLITVDMKLWDSQDKVYKLRKMTEDEFKELFTNSPDEILGFWKILNKATNLNVQRNDLIEEIDTLLVEMGKSGADVSKYIQKAHKTY